MNRQDKSLENIDMTKLLGFVLAFLLVCAVMVLGFIVPNIKEYKAVSQANNSALLAFSKAKYLYDTRQAELDRLRQENKFILQAYGTSFDDKRFVAFVSQFFTDVSLQELKSEHAQDELAGKYSLYELSVSSKADTPKKLYAFLDALSKYENIIRIDFPVQMRGEDGLIRTKFNMRVYSDKSQ